MTWLLGISLTLNALFLVGAAWALRQRPEVARRFMRLGHDQMKSFFEHFRVRPGDVVFLGDSITAGARWSEVFPKYSVRNRGIRGDTTTGVLERLGPIVRGRPAQIFLMIGTNDLGFGRTVEETLSSIEDILRRIRTGSPATEVVVQSLLPRQAEHREAVESLNRGLASLARRFGARWVDLHSSFADANGELRSDLTNDGLHLLGSGYALWAEEIRGLVGSDQALAPERAALAVPRPRRAS